MLFSSLGAYAQSDALKKPKIQNSRQNQKTVKHASPKKCVNTTTNKDSVRIKENDADYCSACGKG